MLFICFVLAAIPLMVLGSDVLPPRQTCGETYQLCSPLGFTTSNLPPVGPGLSSFYPDLVQAINLESNADFSSPTGVDAWVKRQSAGIFCCAQTSQCLLLPSYGTPFCWDRFTTNYYFPDGSYGSIVAGNYTSASGINVNLIYGTWEDQNGMKGNLYSDTPSMMPDTSTLHMPMPWTSSGVGSAIPASELGSSTTMTGTGTQTPSTTISAITLPSTTISIGTAPCGHCSNTIIPGLTGLPPTGPVFTNASGIPATTISGNGTGIPSASNSIYTVTSIIPPFISDAIVSIAVSSRSVFVIAVGVTICTIFF